MKPIKKIRKSKIAISSLPTEIIKQNPDFFKNKKYIYIYKNMESDLSPHLRNEINIYLSLGHKFETIILPTGKIMGGFNNEI